MGKTKALEAKARRLREKERRLSRQSALISKGDEILAAAERRGFEAGHLAGLQQAEEMAKKHRRMTDYLRALRALIGTGDKNAE